ncbi:Probable short-chain dehydrogenase/reductase [Mycobacteroides abscessus]|nr:Probable short-chain dehydrogenase/reductase [Mycobacteroides abscessus]
MACPGQSAYNAAKFAVRGFTESLRQEMIIAKKPVAVTCVHPGGIKTNVARNATMAEGYDPAEFAKLFEMLAHTSPQAAARIILTAVRKKKPRVLVGPDAKAIDILVRLTGARYQDLFSLGARFLMPKRSH